MPLVLLTVGIVSLIDQDTVSYVLGGICIGYGLCMFVTDNIKFNIAKDSVIGILMAGGLRK